MKIAYMTYGRPGSGKSYWCRNHPSYDKMRYINLDNIREAHPNVRPGVHWEIAVQMLEMMIISSETIFIDNTHVRRNFWDMFYAPLKANGYKVVLVYFDIDVDTCLRQNSERAQQGDRNVPAKVIRKWDVIPLERLRYPRDETITITKGD